MTEVLFVGTEKAAEYELEKRGYRRRSKYEWEKEDRIVRRIWDHDQLLGLEGVGRFVVIRALCPKGKRRWRELALSRRLIVLDAVP